MLIFKIKKNNNIFTGYGLFIKSVMLINLLGLTKKDLKFVVIIPQNKAKQINTAFFYTDSCF